jgi:hypothetical protein
MFYNKKANADFLSENNNYFNYNFDSFKNKFSNNKLNHLER